MKRLITGLMLTALAGGTVSPANADWLDTLVKPVEKFGDYVEKEVTQPTKKGVEKFGDYIEKKVTQPTKKGVERADDYIFGGKVQPGTDIDWNELKQGSGPVVFLVNGFGGCSPCIADPLRNKLKESKIAVYNFDWNDIRRRKQSDNFNLTDADFLKQMKSVLDATPDSRPIILIGHSFGGDSILKVAQRTSRKIALLGVLDAVELGGVRTRRSVRNNVDYFYNRWTTNPSGFKIIGTSYASGIPFNPGNSGSLSCEASSCDQKDQSYGYEADGSKTRNACGSAEINCSGYNPIPIGLGGSNGHKHRKLTHGGEDAIYRDRYIHAQLFKKILQVRDTATAQSSTSSSSSETTNRLRSAIASWKYSVLTFEDERFGGQGKFTIKKDGNLKIFGKSIKLGNLKVELDSSRFAPSTFNVIEVKSEYITIRQSLGSDYYYIRLYDSGNIEYTTGKNMSENAWLQWGEGKWDIPPTPPACSATYDPSKYKPGTPGWTGKTAKIAFTNGGYNSLQVRLYHPDSPDRVFKAWTVEPGQNIFLDQNTYGMDWGIQVTDSPVCIVGKVSAWNKVNGEYIFQSKFPFKALN